MEKLTDISFDELVSGHVTEAKSVVEVIGIFNHFCNCKPSGRERRNVFRTVKAKLGVLAKKADDTAAAEAAGRLE